MLMFIVALFTIAQTQKQPKCPLLVEWLKIMWYIYPMEHYSAIKRNEIMPFAGTRIDPEMIILTDTSRKQEDKYHMISLTFGI